MQPDAAMRVALRGGRAASRLGRACPAGAQRLQRERQEALLLVARLERARRNDESTALPAQQDDVAVFLGDGVNVAPGSAEGFAGDRG